MDTHPPYGHKSEYCKNIRYGDGSKKILNAIHCTDKLVADFISFIQSEDPSALIVISSDHLSMPNDAKEALENQNRKNMFLILGENISAKSIKSVSSTFDFAPTVLGSLGFDIKGLGWGRNLLLNNSYASHFKNLKKFDDFLIKNRGFHRSFWGSMKFQGLSFDNETNKFHFASQQMEAPFSISINSTNHISNLMFNGDMIYKILNDPVYKSSNMVYVDKCDAFSKNTISPPLPDSENSELCYLISTTGSATNTYGIVGKKFNIDQNMSPSASLGEMQSIFTRANEIKYQDAIFKPLAAVSLQNKNTVIDISGGVTYQPRLTWEGKEYALYRGITFYGYSTQNGLSEIAHKDFCDPHETADLPLPLASALDNNSEFDYIIYLTADSAFCDKDAFNKFITSLPRKIALENIEFQEPIFSKLEENSEHFIKADKATRMVIADF